MFVLRAQCRLSDASAELELLGVAGTPAAAMLGAAAVWSRSDRDGAALIRLPDAAGLQRCLVAAPAGSEVDVAAAPAMTLDTWRWLEVESGIVTIEAATVDRFVPQMVNFELVGGVDFQKGCYPGQEVVARSQYRGTTKRRTFLFDCDTLPEAGQDVFSGAGAGEAVGTVANAAPHPEQRGGSALIELRLAALDGGDLRLGSADGARLRQRELPVLGPARGRVDALTAPRPAVRELFVWYRVRDDRVAEARAAVRAMQAALAARWPGLQARLLVRDRRRRRPDVDGDLRARRRRGAAKRDGIDGALEQAIASRGALRRQPARRHAPRRSVHVGRSP